MLDVDDYSDEEHSGVDKVSRKSKVTLGVKHDDFVLQFKNQQSKAVPTKNKRLDILEKSIQRLEQKRDDGEKLTATEHNMLFQMKKEVEMIKAEIEKIKKREEENAYFLKTAHVLTEYDKTQIPTMENRRPSTIISPPTNKVGATTSILSFMQNVAAKSAPQPQPQTQPQSKTVVQSQSNDKSKITSFFQVSQSTTNRAQLQDIYMQQIDKSYISDEKYRTYSNNPNKCPNPECGAVDDVLYNYNLGRRNCSVCGIQIDYFFDPSFNSYKATASIELTPEFPYKRENHVSEWLAKIQGKENTEIPEEVFKALEQEFKKNRIRDYKSLKPDFVKKCLKDLKLNKYYDHKEYIIHRFNGLPPPQLSIELEDTFKKMFMQIQAPFEKYCPSSRKNFLSYSYVFHKFCQLLELDELLIYFPLLKSREKLFEQDKIWKLICKDLRWQFIASL